MSELEDKILAYMDVSHTLNSRQKAVSEREIWELHQKEKPDKPGVKREWLKEMFGGAAGEYAYRGQILEQGEWAEDLWGLLDRNINYFTVAEIMRTAKKEADVRGIPRRDAVRTQISLLEKNGLRQEASTGKWVRKSRTPVQPIVTTNGVDKEKEAIHAEVEGLFSFGTQNAKGKTLLLRVEALVDGYVKESVVSSNDVQEFHLQLVKEEFLSFVREACEDFRRHVLSVKAQIRREDRKQKVSREALRHAGDVLGLVPAFGKPIDLKAAKKLMFKRCSPLHPDRFVGQPRSEVREREYQSIIDAYKVMELYNEGLGTEIRTGQ